MNFTLQEILEVCDAEKVRYADLAEKEEHGTANRIQFLSRAAEANDISLFFLRKSQAYLKKLEGAEGK